MNSKSVAAECEAISRCAECLGALALYSLKLSVVERAGDEMAQHSYVDTIALAIHGFCAGIAMQSKDIAEVLNVDDDHKQAKQVKFKPAPFHPVNRGEPNE